jgi:hypothetical protein
MTDKMKLLIEFLYHEYKIYMEMAKLSEENRDKYFRMYLVVISALFGYMGNIYYKTAIIDGKFYAVVVGICLLILFVSFVTGMLLVSSRIGNTMCMKRINVLRKYLRELSCSEINELDEILLPTLSTDRDYYSRESVTLTLLSSLATIMSISVSIISFAVLYYFSAITSICDYLALFTIVSTILIINAILFFSRFTHRLKEKDQMDEEILSRYVKIIDGKMRTNGLL